MQKDITSYLVYAALFAVLLPVLYATGLVGVETLTLCGRYLCFAIAAIGVDLVWGYAGIMIMCQAFFFCLGAYGLGMYLTVSNLPEGQAVPDFIRWNGLEELPLFWKPFASFSGAVVCTLLVTAAAASLTYLIFRRHIKGVFFAIITQALALAMFLLFSRNETMLGGSNGLTNFRLLLGLDLRAPEVKLALYLTTVAMLALIFYLAKRLTSSKFGKVLIGIRDSEARLRFTGYRVANYQTAVVVIGALMAALGGMLYIAQTGIVTPGRMDVKASIEMLIWVALGGRGNLKGAVLGALVVNLLYSLFTSWLPEAWPYILGLFYVATVLFLKDGLLGLLDKVKLTKHNSQC